MFKSARINLTLFYLVILTVFCFVITLSVRVLAEREYLRSNMVQRSELRQIILNVPSFGHWPNQDFANVQENEAEQVRERLNQDMVLINVVALAVGGALSYWFAGRTLRPIEEAHEAQARFAADASHELRTPLTNMQLENEIFLRQKHFNEADARELIKSNLEEVKRMEGLAANLLALTQYGQTSLPLDPLPLLTAVRTAVKQVRSVAMAKHITIKQDVPAAIVRGHQDSLVQLLAILLDNAIKYAPEKSIVTVGGQKRDGYYLLWVQDEGPGISEADLPHIFERLYRGDKARSSQTGGYGLGLSLAKAIVDANGAEIRVQNVPSGGACFMVRLSLVK